MGKVPIRFEMEAEVNGIEFLVTGQGDGDCDQGRCSLSVNFHSVPDGFDPISCPLICHQQTSLSFAESTDPASDIVGLAGGTYEVSPDRTGIIRHPDGEKLAQLEVTGGVRKEDGTLVSRQVMSGTSDLPPLKRNVTPVRDHILPAGPGRATGLTRYKLEAKNGTMLDGVTVIPYKWDNEKSLDAPIARDVDVDAEWDGEQWSDVEYQITMTSLAEDVKVEQAATQPAVLPSDD